MIVIVLVIMVLELLQVLWLLLFLIFLMLFMSTLFLLFVINAVLVIWSLFVSMIRTTVSYSMSIDRLCFLGVGCIGQIGVCVCVCTGPVHGMRGCPT